MADAADVSARAVAACGEHADTHLRADLRSGRVDLVLQSAIGAVTRQDVVLATRVSEALTAGGGRPDAVARDGLGRSVQLLELAIDALDIAAIRPFWKAVLGYADEARRTGREDPLSDPVWQGPAIWFQQMDVARPQRNRIHFDVSVPHDGAPRRLRAALDAGGSLVSDAHAPAFWVSPMPRATRCA